MKKVEAYITEKVIYDYNNTNERDLHIDQMQDLGYMATIAKQNQTRVSYTKFYMESHKQVRQPDWAIGR